MLEIQIISLRGRTAAIVAGDTAILAEHVPDELVARVQAKALYALQIQAGELPGPYTDAGARALHPHRRSGRSTASATRAPGARPTAARRPPSMNAPGASEEHRSSGWR